MLLGSTRTGWCFYIFPMSLDHSITSQTKAEAHSSTDWLPQCGGQLRRCVCVSWTSVKRLLDKIPRPLGITTIRCFIQDHAANRNPCCRRGYGIELLMWLRSLTNWMGHIVYMNRYDICNGQIGTTMWLKNRNTSALSFPGRTWAGSRVQALPSTQNGIQAPVGWIILNFDQPLISL